MSVVIIDYGMGNLGSVARALEECGADVVISDRPEDLHSASHIILPGVGAFTEGMSNIYSGGWVPAIEIAVKQDNIPVLGICLGMQLLADVGYEGGETKGLGLVKGQVRLLTSTSQERIPHVGWNEISKRTDSPLFASIPDRSDFYFVHSYHFEVNDQSQVETVTPYCGSFVSSVRAGNVYGVQFHPEKSQRSGFQLLRNFLSL
ncbi:imidazole glycerol phosphate synthase subunit HisH [Paenibacillus sp. YYML68]|uniref:imidazole glycerol phosphate synthase subunit HisH n=1 Tax=Paenibacillus sp. YYML68 TaxID=2909250 RepID=UPI0024906E00|nr:imidazole glycerol phosphate synthase subunit HisH [Paenibacillus sp. YYML68]